MQTASLSRLREALADIHLTRGLTLDELQRRLRIGVGLHDSGNLLLAFYLADMAERGLHQEAGHPTTKAYAEAVLGLPPRRARELIAVGRKLLELPAILDAHRRQEIGWSKILQLVKVVSPEHEEAWLAFALGHSCRELALEVRLTKPGRPPRGSGNRKGTREIRFHVKAEVSTLTHKKLAKAHEKLAAERGTPVSQAELLDLLAELYLSTDADGSVPGRHRIDSSLYRIVVRPDEADPRGASDAPLVVLEEGLGHVPVDRLEDDTRSACLRCEAQTVHAADAERKPFLPGGPTPRALRSRVLTRDDHRCRHCQSPHQLHVHHIRFLSQEGPTEMANLITLCEPCHALVHDGLLALVGGAADTVTFARAADRTAAEAGLELGGASSRPDAPRPAEPEPAPAPVPFEEAFEDIVGQPRLLQRLRASVDGRRARGRTYPHTLFSGPPGTGKTTIALRLARALGCRLHRAAGPLLRTTEDLVGILRTLQTGDCLMLDEIHAVPRPVLETLYEAMAEGRISLTARTPSGARVLRLDLPDFTVLATTTEDGDLPDALRSRFGRHEALAPYAPDGLAAVVAHAAAAEGVDVPPAACARLAKLARGIPRQALALLDHTLDAACARSARVDVWLVDEVAASLGYDADGLTREERRYLALLRGSPRPMAVRLLARLLGANPRTVTRLVEPDLIRRGLVRVTPRGRMAAPRLLRNLS